MHISIHRAATIVRFIVTIQYFFVHLVHGVLPRIKIGCNFCFIWKKRRKTYLSRPSRFATKLGWRRVTHQNIWRANKARAQLLFIYIYIYIYIWRNKASLCLVTLGLPQFHRWTKGMGPMARSTAGAILLRNTNRPFLSFAVKGNAAKRSLRLQIAAASTRKNLRA